MQRLPSALHCVSRPKPSWSDAAWDDFARYANRYGQPCWEQAPIYDSLPGQRLQICRDSPFASNGPVLDRHASTTFSRWREYSDMSTTNWWRLCHQWWTASAEPKGEHAFRHQATWAICHDPNTPEKAWSPPGLVSIAFGCSFLPLAGMALGNHDSLILD